MRRRIGRARGRLARVALLALLVCAGPALAQEAAEPAPETAAPETPKIVAIPVAEVSSAAESLRVSLRAVAADARPDAAVEAIEAKLPERAAGLEERERSTGELLAGQPALTRLRDEEAYWRDQAQALASDRGVATARALALDARLEQLDGQREQWRATRDAVLTQDAPEVLEQVDASLTVIRDARTAIEERRSVVLALQTRLSAAELRIGDIIAKLHDARAAARASLLAPDAPVWWGALSTADEELSAWDRSRAYAEEQIENLKAFFRATPQKFALHFLLFLGLLALTLSLRPRARAWAEEDESFRSVAELFGRPWAMAFLLALALSPLLHRAAPSVVIHIWAVTLLIPLLRLVPAALGSAGRRVFWGVSALVLVDQLRVFAVAVPSVSRMLLLAECSIAAAGVLWLLRPARLEGLRSGAQPLILMAAALRAALVLFVLAVAVNLAGYVGLAGLLADGAVRGAYLAFLLLAAVAVVLGLVRALLRVRPLRLLYSVRRHRSAIVGWLRTTLRVAAGLAWLYFTLGFFSLQHAAVGALRSAVESEFVIGEVSLSLGKLLGFALVLAVGLWLARIVRIAVDEEMVPRVTLPRGAGHTIAVTAQYAIGLFAFVLATGAAGIDMGRFAIVAGALGVGIGFGLQNVVNNFVSGLILLFERPVQVGDTIEMPDVFGDVRRVGIRSSTVRTWQGAEVIIPNAMLVSDRVINWTKSDRLRRLEIPVGVAYGTDPQRVIDVLRGVAEEHADVVKNPEPNAIFMGFGDSSLDFELRAWTARFESYMQLRSALCLEIDAALKAADITIPFPQRDLHVKTGSVLQVATSSPPAPGRVRGEPSSE